jgi:hypothetical protein
MLDVFIDWFTLLPLVLGHLSSSCLCRLMSSNQQLSEYPNFRHRIITCPPSHLQTAWVLYCVAFCHSFSLAWLQKYAKPLLHLCGGACRRISLLFCIFYCRQLSHLPQSRILLCLEYFQARSHRAH